MIRFDKFQYSKPESLEISNSYSINPLVSNEVYDDLCLHYIQEFQNRYDSLKTFSFLKEGFLGLLLELRKKSDKVAISVGETQALIDGAKLYESLGFEIIWINLNKDGTTNLCDLKNNDIDFLFISSYIMDTFVKVDLSEIKKYTQAKIISNATANYSNKSDAIYFDNYKLTGFNLSGVILFNGGFFELLSIGQIDTIALKLCLDELNKKHTVSNEIKPTLLEELQNRFGDDIHFFVDNNMTLDNSLHFGLKGIKARELIRTLALGKIYLSNGEGCSLGLSKPSRIIYEMGYDEKTTREALSLSFDYEYSKKQIDEFVNTLYLKYKQLQMLG